MTWKSSRTVFIEAMERDIEKTKQEEPERCLRDWVSDNEPVLYLGFASGLLLLAIVVGIVWG